MFAALHLEISLVLLAFLVLSVGLVRPGPSSGKTETALAIAGLLALLGLTHFSSLFTGPSPLDGVFSTGPTALFFKQLFLISALLTCLLSWPAESRSAVAPFRRQGEYLGLLLFSVVGMCTVVSAREMTALYLGLELVTMPMVLLVAFNREEQRSAEAGLKYVFFSALSSGLLLYGLSFVYGMTGTLHLETATAALTAQPLTWVALALVLAGVGFKVSAVPFHLWTPDTYEGAPAAVSAFLSVASKAAGFAVFTKLVVALFGPALPATNLLLGLLATLTMTFGNLVAIHQTNLKRFLAYSSIAQAGYLILGLVNPGLIGSSSVLFYLLVYVFSNLAAFGVVIAVASATGREDLRQYAGLSRSNPGLALIMMLAVFSLAGIPPLAGFLGKFYLFAAAAEVGQYWLVFAGAINATISLYYYLIVVKWMYIAEPVDEAGPVPPFTLSLPARAALFSCSAGLVVIGLLPQFLAWSRVAAFGGF